jgi:hypothetical protein
MCYFCAGSIHLLFELYLALDSSNHKVMIEKKFDRLDFAIELGKDFDGGWCLYFIPERIHIFIG